MHAGENGNLIINFAWPNGKGAATPDYISSHEKLCKWALDSLFVIGFVETVPNHTL